MMGLLQRSPALRTIDMGGKNFNHSNDLLEMIGETCLEVETLNLSQSGGIDGEGVLHLRKCTQLREVNFSECPLVTDESLASAIECWTLLETLILYNSQVGSRTLKAIAQTSQKLRYLNLGNCPNMTTKELHLLIVSCGLLNALFLENLSLNVEEVFCETSYPTLLKLSLRGIPLNDQTFLGLAQKMAHLRELNLSRCYGITYAGLRKGLSHLPELRVLDIRGSSFNSMEMNELAHNPMTIFDDRPVS